MARTARYRLRGDGPGLGQRSTDRQLDDAMTALDMPAGCECQVVGIDEERGLTLLRWTGDGITRFTSVDDDQLNTWFEKV